MAEALMCNCGNAVTAPSRLLRGERICNRCLYLNRVERRRKAGIPVQTRTPAISKSKNGTGKRYRRRLRLEVIALLGSICTCRGCEEWRVEFMEVDHINGGGSAERKKLGFTKFYRRVLSVGAVEYRLLCSNCNHARGVFGYCPHERES